MIEPFISAVPVLEQLEAAGFEAYFVGGSVRDYLLKKPINDVDIAVSATPDEVKQVFLKTVDVGIEHGTLLVLFNGQSYEITTFRTEGEYQDYRRPKEVSFIRNLTEDLQRRDFTMNAMAMDKNGNIIDPFNGKSAIKNKLIQTVGSPYERFQEDALRMMRGVRFVSQLGFCIDDTTYDALVNMAELLEKIAVERKQAEFSKLLSGEHRKQGLQLLIDSNLITYLPGLGNQQAAIEELLRFDLDPLNTQEMWAILGFCLRLEGKEIEVFYRSWRLPLKEIREIQLILSYLKKRFLSEWSNYDLYSAGRQIFTASELLYLVITGENAKHSIQQLQHRYQELPMKDRSEMDVTGNDLMNWYKNSGGPWLKEKLFAVEKAILAGEVNNSKQGIKEWLMECNHK
jgi:tRNA nucleotidyltransferase (CCA-adding enzyme)